MQNFVKWRIKITYLGNIVKYIIFWEYLSIWELQRRPFNTFPFIWQLLEKLFLFKLQAYICHFIFVNYQENMTDFFCQWPPYLAICIAGHNKWSVSPIYHTNQAPLMQLRHLYPLWPHFLFFTSLSALPSLIRILLNCVNMSKVAIKYECFWCDGISLFKVSKRIKRPQQRLRIARNWFVIAKIKYSHSSR